MNTEDWNMQQLKLKLHPICISRNCRNLLRAMDVWVILNNLKLHNSHKVIIFEK